MFELLIIIMKDRNLKNNIVHPGAAFPQGEGSFDAKSRNKSEHS